MPGRRRILLPLTLLATLLMAGCFAMPAPDRPTTPTEASCMDGMRAPDDPDVVPLLTAPWSKAVPEHTSFEVTDGAVVTARGGLVMGHSLTTGDQQWTFAYEEHSGGELIAVGAIGVMLVTPGRSYLLSPSGALLWDGPRVRDPIPVGTGVAFEEGSNLTLLRPDGPRWTVAWSVATVPDTITAALAADAEGGWVFRLARPAWSTPWFRPPTWEMTVYAYETALGDLRWNRTLRADQESSASYQSLRAWNGRLLLLGDAGEGEREKWAEFAALEATTGALLGRSRISLGTNWTYFGEPAFVAATGPDVAFWRPAAADPDETRNGSLVVGRIDAQGRFVERWHRRSGLGDWAGAHEPARLYLWGLDVRQEPGRDPRLGSPRHDPTTQGPGVDTNVSFYERNFVIQVDGETGRATGCAAGEWDLAEDRAAPGPLDYPRPSPRGFVEPAEGRLVTLLALEPGPQRLASFG